MKVLYLIDTLEGYGAERSLVEIAINLKQTKPVFVHLYTGSQLKPVLEEKGIKVYSLNIPLTYGYRQAVELISPIIEIEKPDIIHSTLFRADMVARKLKDHFPEIISVGSFVSNSYGKQRFKQLSLISKLKLFSTQLKDRFTAGKVDYYVCNSQAIKKTNIRALGISKEKIQVIYRGRSIPDSSFTPQIIAGLRKELGLPEGKIFLNVGRLQKGKGQQDLLYAFKEIHEKFENTLLVIAGEGSFRKELQIIIEKLSLQKNVFLLGYREDIPQLIAISDYFVFPSYFEGLPGALIEAIIGKIPSIVSDIPENRECFPKGGALYFTPGDVGEIVKKIEEALQLNDWDKKIQLSFDHACKSFDIELIGKKYDEFYTILKTEKELTTSLVR